MSLAIDIDEIDAVLLSDGWHTVNGYSFDLDSYEYVREVPAKPNQDLEIRLGGGNEPLIPAIGATWTERTDDDVIVQIFCPLTAIQAVRIHKQGFSGLAYFRLETSRLV